MEFSNTIEIKFKWWCDEIEEIDFEVKDKLEGHAEERIIEMRKEGYTSGELHCEINNVQYRGWWEYSYI